MNELAQMDLKRREEKRRRKNLRHEQKNLSKTLKTTIALKQLRSTVYPIVRIPYRAILSEDGYLSTGMKHKLSDRKMQLLDELYKMSQVEEKFNCKF